MTANQIAYADVLVKQASQEEVERHNKVLEELTAQQNEVAAKKVENEILYNQEMIRINNMRAYSEQDRVHIEQMKVHETERYNTLNYELGVKQNYINQTLAEESKRHNLSGESLKANELFLSNKKLEFDKYAFDVGSDINWFNARTNYELGWENMLNSRKKIQNEYELGSKHVSIDWYNASTNAQNARIRSQELEFSKYRWDQEMYLNLENQNIEKAKLKSNTAAWIAPFILPHADSIVSGAARILNRR